MGTNYYIDQGEGDDYYSYPHIGKTSRLSQGLTFIFFKSRYYQISLLQSLDMNDTIINEYGDRTTVREFLDYIVNLPYMESNEEFL